MRWKGIPFSWGFRGENQNFPQSGMIKVWWVNSSIILFSLGSFFNAEDCTVWWCALCKTARSNDFALSAAECLLSGSQRLALICCLLHGDPTDHLHSDVCRVMPTYLSLSLDNALLPRPSFHLCPHNGPSGSDDVEDNQVSIHRFLPQRRTCQWRVKWGQCGKEGGRRSKSCLMFSESQLAIEWSLKFFPENYSVSEIARGNRSYDFA